MKYLLLFICSISLSFAQEPIQGWTSTKADNILEMSPPQLPPNRSFLYSLHPASRPEGSVKSWLRSIAEADLPQLGKSIKPLQYTFNGPLHTYTGAVMHQGKAKLVVYLSSSQQGSIPWARVLTDADAAFFKPYLPLVIKHFTSESKVSFSQSTPQTASGSQPRKKSARVETPLTAPGQGLKDDQIAGVYMHLESNFGVGGFVTQDYEAYLFMKDGTVYKYPKVCPYDLDVAASRQVESRKWGHWQKAGTTIRIQWSDGKTSDWDRWHIGRRASTGEKITGSYKSISGGGNVAFGGNTTVASMKVITFNANGQFHLQSSGGGISAGVSAYSNKDQAGTYELDQYMITLKFNNGTQERRFFYFYPDRKDCFGLGSGVYVPVK